MDSRLKVLWLCNIMLPQIQQAEGQAVSPYGGWVSSLLDQLMAREDQIMITVIFPQPTPAKISGVIGNVQYHSAAYNPFLDSYDPADSQLFINLLQEEKPDVVHIFGTECPSTLAMLEAVESLGLINRTIVSIQGLVSVISRIMYTGLPAEVQLSGSMYERVYRQTLRHAQKTLAKRGELEKLAIRKARNFFGRTDWDHACVYNLNPEAHYYYCPEILRTPFYSGRWTLEACDRHTIFAVAEHPIKGLPYLLQALPTILAKYPDTKVRIAGLKNVVDVAKIFAFLFVRSYDQYITTLIDRNGLTQCVEFLGRLDVERMKEEYLRANVFVLPSIIENESNTLSEAKILGVPCVASYVGGALSRIEHGVDGYQYPCAEPEILAYYVCKIFEDQDKAAAMGQRAHEKMTELCDPDEITETVLRVYRELAEGSAQ